MRIVGGQWRGRTLVTAAGRTTRPTQERVREALASMVASARGLSFASASVLDPFCGTGALSLELLSRGAPSATLIERDSRSLVAAHTNVENLGALSRVVFMKGDAWKTVDQGMFTQAPFELVLFDPPYATSPVRLLALVERMAERALLDQKALVVHERSREETGLSAASMANIGFELHRSNEFGHTSLDLWKRTDFVALF